MLTRDKFLTPPALKQVKVELAELGGHVFVRELTTRERDRLDAAAIKRKGKNARAALVATITVDESGRRVFTDSDFDAINDLPAAIVDRLIEAHASLGAEARDEGEDLV